ncbi:hypothetical protein GQ55_4G273600 [Panicum hallii var. hallii]|uniref:Uncharacterized protein n=2 Tax=Panicum hallii TaxID=206008 RepID=A0A2T7E0N8_9POAL|nr:uncharacterized protein LOC112890224 [Panicum hallii]PUZ61406.1 hypothetical protein GQ55_4G273600 [Panicum hallii var. hallii]PVH48143.1 hypothetical protein PAHAL_4G260800 [Panicum hallii]
MLLLPAAGARDATACPLGLQTLIAADSDAPTSSSSSPWGGNVATRTIAASARAVRCLASASGGGVGDGCDGREGEEGGGCWVSYGWRRRPRRLPPPIPSLRPLARERTADGRLVISREGAAHRVGARKVEDRRLVLELVDERDGGAAAPAHQQRPRRWSHPLDGHQEAKPAAGEEAAARAPAASPVPAEACFEGAIRAASRRGMRMSLPRMVH